MSEPHNRKAQEILVNVRYASVATVTPNGRPWNSPVAHEMDVDYNRDFRVEIFLT